jgi:hypothetical protein
MLVDGWPQEEYKNNQEAAMTSRKVLLFCIIAGFVGFLLAGIGLYYGVRSGVSLGQYACLTNVQHSTDAALINSVALSASNRNDAAIAYTIVGLVLVGASGFLLGARWMAVK